MEMDLHILKELQAHFLDLRIPKDLHKARLRGREWT
jgi:hypothetical protein